MGSEYDIRAMLESPETTGTALHAFLLAKYGPDVYDWEPETVTLEVIDDYAVEIPSKSFNRWAAIQTIMTTDAFFKRIDAFMAVCNTLTSGEPYFTIFDPLTTAEMAWGVAEASLNRDMLPFSRSVREFIRKSAALEGYAANNMPTTLAAALEADGDVRAAIGEAYRTDNNDALDAFMDEQLGVVAFQLDNLPAWKGKVTKFLQSDELVLPDAQEDL